MPPQLQCLYIMHNTPKTKKTPLTMHIDITTCKGKLTPISSKLNFQSYKKTNQNPGEKLSSYDT